MSRYSYDPDTYRYCMYYEIEYGKDEEGVPKVVKLGDAIVTSRGGRGRVTAIHDIKTADGLIDQGVTFRDATVPDDAPTSSTIGPDGKWVVMDDRYGWTLIEDIVEVVSGDRT